MDIKYVRPSVAGNGAMVEYTETFPGTGDLVSGNVNVSGDELVSAYQSAEVGDPYAGVKKLVVDKLLVQIQAEAGLGGEG